MDDVRPVKWAQVHQACTSQSRGHGRDSKENQGTKRDGSIPQRRGPWPWQSGTAPSQVGREVPLSGRRYRMVLVRREWCGRPGHSAASDPGRVAASPQQAQSSGCNVAMGAAPCRPRAACMAPGPLPALCPWDPQPSSHLSLRRPRWPAHTARSDIPLLFAGSSAVNQSILGVWPAIREAGSSG
jgi:hypothetical protein